MALNAPIYEEIELGRNFTNKAKLTGGVQRGKSFKEVREYVESKKPGTAKNEKQKKTKRFTYYVVVLSVLALPLTAMAVLASNSHVQVENLKTKIQEMENKLNHIQDIVHSQIKLQIENIENRLNQTIQSLVDTLNTKTMTQLDSLQSSVNTLNTTTMAQLSNLQSSVNTLNTTTMVELSSLQSSVDTLNITTVDPIQSSGDTPDGLYQNCIQETRSCQVVRYNTYWISCITATLPINSAVSENVVLSLFCMYT